MGVQSSAWRLAQLPVSLEGVRTGPGPPRCPPPGDGDSSQARVPIRPAGPHVCPPYGRASVPWPPAPVSYPAGTRVRGERARHRPGPSTASHTPAAAGRSIRRRGPRRSRLVRADVTSHSRRGAPRPRSRAALGWAPRMGAAPRALTARSAAAAAAALASPPRRAPGFT